MRSGLVHLLAWTLATGAAVTLSWWGVHTVMAGTAYDPPRALPLTVGEVTSTPRQPSPRPSSPTGTSASPTPSAARPSASPTRSGSPAGTPAAAKTSPAGTVKSYDTDGGRVVLDLTGTYATLVSATPAAGWSVQVWKTESWIRVDFASGADRVSVFCTWHDGPPRVDVQTF
ncbi:hypothetical protein [Streptomyces sp. DSM 15324]|uniref:hypothetical protein n=1 Tax=Streptomyces sp. DSM 15324 TaxID=1739111 RepID=UPI000748A5DF|nr:hypothetical protein [Streptomyces sp. DSM 15324]KUO13705.1 hypothetical protein AQJ58_01015 [Streptomyces sp. DSM 15324]